MAFDVYIDSFTLGSTLGAQSIAGSGLTFTPTSIITANNRLSSDGIAAPAQLTLSVASTIGDSPFHRRVAGFVSDDAEASADVGITHSQGSIISMFNNAVSQDALANLTSFDATPGFSIDISNTPVGTSQVNYAVLAGDVIIEPFVMNFGTSAGNVTKTGLTNQPKAVVLFATVTTTGNTAVVQSVTATPVMGWMCADGTQGYSMTRHADGAAAANTARRQLTSKCFGMFDAAGGELVEAEFVAMTTQGFTVSLANAPTGDWRAYGWAIYGSTDHAWTAGSFICSTSTSTFDVTTTGVDPKFTILQTVGAAASTSIQDHGLRSMGMSNGTQRFSLAYVDRDAADPMDTNSGMDRTKALTVFNTGGNLVNTLDITHSTGKFIVDHSLSDGTAFHSIFLVGGTATSTGGAPAVTPRAQRFMALGVS